MKLRILLLAAACIISLPCHAQQKTVKKNAASSETLTDASIIELSKAGLGDDVILSKIASSQSNFDLSTVKLIELKKAGVNSAVINAMMSKLNGAPPAVAAMQTTKMPQGRKASLSLQILNYPYYFDNAGNAYKPIEKASSGMRTKNKAFGYGGAEVFYDIDGAKSPIRLNGADSVSFVINTGNNPLPELVLYKLKVDGQKRSAIAMSMSVFSGVKAPKNTIPFNTVQLGNGLYKFVFTNKLAAGEYFFSGKPVANSTTVDVFAFGID
ncbi:hypothetical protein [Mucilaginibacter paludis]|uniref:Uncharacterized protein n=1 Tax=Mucilaginibacter paludis DSM 18603 TaxID=714943 RepID=H1Y5L9_9SPHI|nr:hypothetical protein [Mucilaginibacter paludis]EHQ29795.1 hypothetical protein Mucpa_5727 [Mucilaginibacter paludis DSM 18603]